MNNTAFRFLRVILVILLTLTLIKEFVYGNEGKRFEDVEDIADLSIEDLLKVEVNVASKKAEKTADAPGIIEVITAQEIRAFGAVSIIDILQRATGIQPISSHLFPQNMTNIRGDYMTHYDNHVLILIDGRPIRELLTGGIDSPVYTAFPIDLIEQIEIIRGPGSVLYGTNAFAGVINIITKQEFKDSSAMFTLGGGSFGAINGAVTAGTTRGDLKAVVGARFFKEDGWNYKAMTVNPASPLPPAAVDMKYSEKKIGIFSNLSYKTFHLSAFYANFNDYSLGTIPIADHLSSSNGNRLFLDLGFTGNLSTNWSSNANFTLNLTDIVLQDDNPLYPPADNSSWGYLGEVSINGKITNNLHLIVGGVIDIRKNIYRDNSTIKEAYSQTHLSAYTQIDYMLLKGFKLIAGAQLNKPYKGDIDIVPRLGLVCNFTNGIGLKALYGRAFRSAWPIEQMLDSTVAIGNPDLDPERIGTLDLQISYQRKTSRLSLTYFHSHVSDIVTRVPSIFPGRITYVNKDNMDVEGFEFEVKASPVESLFITGSAMYQDNKDNKTYSPHVMLKVGTAYHTSSGLSLGLFLTHFGKALKNKGLELNPEANAVNLLTLNLGFKPVKKLPVEINLYIQNLLDEDYYFTEYARGWVNTLPNGPGRAIYSNLIIRL